MRRVIGAFTLLILSSLAHCGSDTIGTIGTLPCASSDECEEGLCDTASGACVECLTQVDCPDPVDDRCVDNHCVPPCASSLDCALGKVCDAATGTCVACVTDADCGSDGWCADSVCRVSIPCASDVTCTPSGMLCDLELGACRECVTHAHCENADHCRAGLCVPDVCPAGRRFCDGASLMECEVNGVSEAVVTVCDADSVCVALDEDASCQTRVCDPGDRLCENGAAHVCAADGLGWVEQERCDGFCAAGQCFSSCAPGSARCLDGVVGTCVPGGDGFDVGEPCDAGLVCVQSGETAACVPPPCGAGPAACDGYVVRACVDGELGETLQDCAATGERCYQGACVSDECEVLNIEVAEGLTVLPQTELHLSASIAATSYAWSVEGPEGGCPALRPNATAATPTLAVNLVGSYTIRVTVTGVPSGCPTEATRVVRTVPQADVHVQLTWDTAGDPDQCDEGATVGADLDLHYLNPLAAGSEDCDDDGVADGWFDVPWDAFWYNPHPNWALFDYTVDDNPGLNRDDADGGGPENLTHSGLETGRYRIGVHYWNDHGFGPSGARVQVWIQGEPAFDERATLSMRDMWNVGSVVWPAGVVETARPCGDDGCAPDLCVGFTHPFGPGDN